MKVRKLLSLMLCVAMVLIATPASSVYAEDTPTPRVYVESVYGVQGSTVGVNVGIQNASDLAGLQVSVFYDADALSVISADQGSDCKIPEDRCSDRGFECCHEDPDFLR